MLLSATEDFFGAIDPLCEENSFVLSSDNSAYIKIFVKYRAVQRDERNYIITLYQSVYNLTKMKFISGHFK